ncbi:translocation protein SEC62 [Hyalella azteca]|uniref:Translocation protein SEC62 n=1 Tax=Hyalella azteca TaxID=294128 RepID=A0A8B7NJS5_HYAAZ|nr:translocation protein SEC62 [Hyalella azteca]
MSQRKLKKKEQDVAPIPLEDKPTKLDYTIASYMKKNTPTKRTKFLHHQVNYFYASKAVDVLLDSQWATGKDAIFRDRQSVVDYCNKLLTQKFFHRARKIPVTERDLKPKELKKKREKEEKEKEKEKNKKEKIKKRKELSESEDTKKEDDDQNDDRNSSTKKKRKIKLDMHLEQLFVDGSDAYVWMYDPVPFWYYIAGALCLLAAVAICLFPLWPPMVRKGVYYLSVAAASFLGVILGLAVVRFIVFLIIWVLSMGRHHLWLLPNLTEDVGFLASFWPLYHYEYRGADFDRKKSKKSKKKVTLNTAETEDDNKRSDREGPENTSAGETDRPETDGERHDRDSGSNGESDASQHSQSFELLHREDLDTGDEQDDHEEPPDQTQEEDKDSSGHEAQESAAT